MPAHSALRTIAFAVSLLPFAALAADKGKGRESLDLATPPHIHAAPAIPPAAPLPDPVDPIDIPPAVVISLNGIEKGVSEAAYLKLARAEFARLDRDRDGVLTRKDLPKPKAIEPSAITPPKGAPDGYPAFVPPTAPPVKPPVPPEPPAVKP